MILPEDCVCTILSHTTPRDACIFSLVSWRFRSLAESDLLWESFLPEEYADIVRRALYALHFSSKKDLFFCLCFPTLIDAGTKSIQLVKSSGKITYILSAREISIQWSNDPLYWCWKYIPDSRFAEVVELRTISWLEIHGNILTKSLSKNTAYGAYLLLRTCDRAHGLDSMPSEVSVQVGGNQVSAGTAYLCCEDSKEQRMEGDGECVPCRPRQRPDGWLEIELGEFFVGGDGDGDGDGDEVKMSLMEVKGYQLKGGIVIEGIEVRPKH